MPTPRVTPLMLRALGIIERNDTERVDVNTSNALERRKLISRNPAIGRYVLTRAGKELLLDEVR